MTLKPEVELKLGSVFLKCYRLRFGRIHKNCRRIAEALDQAGSDGLSRDRIDELVGLMKFARPELSIKSLYEVIDRSILEFEQDRA